MNTAITVALVALGPVVLVMITSFVKVSVVLALTRNAIGAQEVPPPLVVTGLSVLLTIFIMTPVAQQAYAAIEAAPPVTAMAGPPRNLAEQLTPDDARPAFEAAARAAGPVRAFLLRHAHAADRATFAGLASKLAGAPVADDDLLVLAPAFATSELTEAFAIGFLLLLPFLVLDLVVGLSLTSLGLTQVSAPTIALPLKLLLFVAIDGWRLLAEGLIKGYL
ncbi:MAG: EscR/YscR/HrcR family type III secretion system export apparatus protein [Deltaproteobacteria bacterium]|nr:EscR/YscR/HrcR family type III secretion system export apparatus protein [Deltaproteobacteria bacterium]